MEIVHEGWLKKSPPEKRIWKAKWRQRWFVLKHSGQIPNQYVLEYYADANRRKFKGSIDLDICEQVDAGLQVESRKANYQHMFDVRTSKRTYYLVAKSEEEMNKWVDCICSVCGLKIDVDEGADYRYSPQPSQELNAPMNGASTSVASIPALTQTPNVESNNISASSIVPSVTHSKSNSQVSVTLIDGPSGPYIPISECHTGKPVNGSVVIDNNNSIPMLSKINKVISDECYDVPRQLNPLSNSNENNSVDRNDLLYQVPAAPCAIKTQRNSNDSVISNPPKVNWNTYPKEPIPEPNPRDSFNANDGTRYSTRSCNASVDVTQKHSSVNDSGNDTQRSSSPLSSELNRDSIVSTDGNPQPPPRPPKPPSLRKSKSRSESCASLPIVSSSTYDVPATAVEQGICNDSESSPTFKLPYDSPKSPDEAYDFPRRTESAINFDSDLINEKVPLAIDKSTLRNSKKHSYTNAAPGFFMNKESVFNYDYKPSLPSSADDHVTSPANKPLLGEIELSHSDRSPLSPNSTLYNNTSFSSSLPNTSCLNTTPPAVNRDLKPKRKGSDGDASTVPLSSSLNMSNTSVPTLQLAPPPALTRIHSAPTKRSFRKPRISPVQSQVTINGTPPRIPSRNKQFQHNRDPSTSEDDLSVGGNGSRRNSSNDDPTAGKGTVVPPPRRPLEGGEIQYLDLDLDSDSNSQSPRTPIEHHHQRSNSTLSNKESKGSNTPTIVSSGSGSTVYKTVDFLKTDAFNKMRKGCRNVEIYRNSQ